MNLAAVIKRLEDGTAIFRALPSKMRTAIVGFLWSEGVLTEQLAAQLHIPISTVYYHRQKYEKQLAGLVRENAGQFIGRLVARGEHLYKSAKAAGDLALCWRIEKDLMRMLMKLGLVDSVPARLDVRLGPAPFASDVIEAELAGDLTLLKRAEGRARELLEVRDGNGQGGNGNGAPSNGSAEPVADGAARDADDDAEPERVPEPAGEGGDQGAL